MESKVHGMQQVTGPILPPEITTTADPSIPWAACFPLFGRFRRDVGVDNLIGEAKVPPIMLPVQLTLVQEQVRTFNDVCNALRHCIQLCTIMENQMSLMKNTYCHRVSLIQHLITRVIPIPLPLNHPHRETKCFWARQPMRYETQADLLRLLDLVNRHYAACSLSLRVTRSFDAIRMLTSASIAAITDCVLRTRACDIPSLLSLHYSGQAEGPIFPFGFDAGYFRLESDNAKLPDPHLQVVRSLCLDYFTQLRNSLQEDHIIFRFETSMDFGVGEKALMDQLCLQMGFPRDDLASYLSGENPVVLDNFPELGFFRDIVYLFKALLAPSSESLPELRPWRARDAALSWAYKLDGGFNVRGFGSRLKCAAFVKPEDLVNKGGFLTRLSGLLGLAKPRAPPSGADPSNLVGEKVDTEGENYITIATC